MSEPPAPLDKAAVMRAMARLDGFARGLGMDRATARQIVETVVINMRDRDDDERLTEARKRMLKA